jgi:hypothetical protein
MLSRPLVEAPMQAADGAPWAPNNCVHLRSVKAQQMDTKI